MKKWFSRFFFTIVKLGFRKSGRATATCFEIFKLILHIKSSTPNLMVYGETGVYPIYIDIYCRMISFWATLVSGPPAKLSYVVYRTAYSLYTFENNSSNKFKWFQTVKYILCSCGFVEYGTIIRFPIKRGSSVQ